MLPFYVNAGTTGLTPVEGPRAHYTGAVQYPITIGVPPKPTNFRPVLTTIWQRRLKRTKTR